jgi:hypothetical protein
MKTKPCRVSHRCPAALLEGCFPESLSLSEELGPRPPLIQPLREIGRCASLLHVHGDAWVFLPGNWTGEIVFCHLEELDFLE